MAEKKEKKESKEVIKIADKITFRSEHLGREKVSALIEMHNMTDDMYIVKVKCTSNAMFRIMNVHSFIEPKNHNEIAVVFNPGHQIPKDSHHFVAIHYSKSSILDGFDIYKGLLEIRQEFWKDRKIDGTKRVYIDFKNPNGVVNRNQKFEIPKEKEKTQFDLEIEQFVFGEEREERKKAMEEWKKKKIEEKK